MAELAKTHDVPVLGVVTKGADVLTFSSVNNDREVKTATSTLCPPMSVAAMHGLAAHQNFRGVPVVTPQDDEAAFGEMEVQGTGLVDKHELTDALREMGNSERVIQQVLDTVTVNVDVPG